MDQEQVFLAALASATGYRFAGARIELMDTTGNALLVFEPLSAMSVGTTPVKKEKRNETV